jgi:hypothetical protein
MLSPSYVFSILCNVHMGTISLVTFGLQNLCCRNPSLGLITKARACESVGQVWSPWVTFHAHGSSRECEGMNPHTPKWVPILGVEVPMNFQIFKEQL